MKGLITAFFALLIVVGTASGQASSKLADQYYLDGEYEKAAQLYERLATQANRSDYYFTKYIECLLALDEFEKSEEYFNRYQVYHQERNHQGKANLLLYPDSKLTSNQGKIKCRKRLNGILLI